MGGGDLNMKKSWHPALLVNQERVWKAQKEANEEKKALQQLRKEREEERQLAELQRMQEAATGKKRVEKLDWMYAAPSAEDGAMGGRMSERELEDYLLGKKRVDEVLAAGDKNVSGPGALGSVLTSQVGASHREFVAVQNANTARDTAAKIREDPVLAMKKAEQAAIAALMNRPDIRRQLKQAKKEREGGDDKEERRAKRRAEKEERRRERHERRERRDYDRDYDRSPRSEYSDDRRDRSDRRGRDYDDRRRDDRGYGRDSRDDYDRRADRDSRERRDDRDRRPRSRSPQRDRDDSRDRRHESARSDERRSNGHSDRRPSPKREPYSPKRERYDARDSRDSRNGHSNGGPSNGHSNGHSNGYANGRSDERYDNARPPRRASPERKPYVKSEPAPAASSAQDDRAARLAAMSSNATTLNAERTEKLARRAIEEKAEEARDEKARSRYHRDEAAGLFMKHQEQMSGQIGLAESLQRRGGKGLLRDI